MDYQIEELQPSPRVDYIQTLRVDLDAVQVAYEQWIDAHNAFYAGMHNLTAADVRKAVTDKAKEKLHATLNTMNADFSRLWMDVSQNESALIGMRIDPDDAA